MSTAHDGKGGRYMVAGASIGASLVAVTLALAQPRNRPPHGAPRSKGPAATDAASDDGGAMASGAASVVASSSSAPPFAVPEPAGDGGKLSPLNPNDDEFSDGGAARSVDYDRLLSDIAALRARVAAVSDTLFHSRVAISIEVDGDHAKTGALRVSLDDGVVWTSPVSYRPEAKTVVYEHAVAPGHHAVTVDVERRDDHADAFRSSQQSRFVVEVPADRRLAVEIALNDDSDMGEQFPSSLRGQYDLRVRLRARSEAVSR